MAHHAFISQNLAVLGLVMDLVNVAEISLKNHILKVVSMLLENLSQNPLQP